MRREGEDVEKEKNMRRRRRRKGLVTGRERRLGAFLSWLCSLHSAIKAFSKEVKEAEIFVSGSI